MLFTKSWFVCNPPRRTRAAMRHPAKFPEPLVRSFLEFFTRPGECVLDPFLGTGSTLVAAAACGRRGVGLEVSSEFAQIAREAIPASDPKDEGSPSPVVLEGDARRAVELCRAAGIETVQYVITSPPYWNMLRTSRGNVTTAHKERARQGLPVTYSASDLRDLGNITDYEEFLAELTQVLAGLKPLLARGRYLTVVLQNIRKADGEVAPLAWDLTASLRDHYTFKGERLWLQDNKRLGMWGYPSEFVTNVHHHYCLNFKNDR
ncbi:MAG TPA: DNA methyltransferase [Armatimonadota bacterium]|jgi:hypothetical protein